MPNGDFFTEEELSLVNETVDIEGETDRTISETAPPVGTRTYYGPGSDEGFLARMRGPGEAMETEPQARLEQLEAAYPEGMPGPSVTSGPMITTEGGGRKYRMPESALGEAQIGAAGGGLPFPTTSVEAAFSGFGGAPVYKIPSEWESRFNDVLREVIEPGKDIETLRLMAKGFNLPAGQSSKYQMLAATELAKAEGNRRRSIASLAGSLTQLMIEPSRFAERQFERMLGHGEKMGELGLRHKELGLKGEMFRAREKALEEAPAKTFEALTPEGSKQVLQWDRESKTYKPIAEGMAPVTLRKGQYAVAPMTGKVIAGMEEGLPTTEMAKTVHSEYVKKRSKFSEEYGLKDINIRTDKEVDAYNEMAGGMERLGFGEQFKTLPRYDEFETFYKTGPGKKRALTDEQIRNLYTGEIRKALGY